ncbi:MAG: response regulator [Caldilineales bacterium]|nr:response regulator [Caldilineales bacterium]MDW8316854.1 response regulator [Anaerolineae bacterium]
MTHRVLLVSNAGTNRWGRLVQEVLKEMDALLITARNGQLQQQVQEGFSAVIVDASSFGLGRENDVVTMIRALRARSALIPIVVVTSSLSWEVAREYLRAGASDYIPQTFDREKLARRLSAALHLSAP